VRTSVHFAKGWVVRRLAKQWVENGANRTLFVGEPSPKFYL